MSTVVTILSALALVLVAVWGVVNLSQGDWFIGIGMTVSAVVALWSLAVRRSPKTPV